MPFSGDIVTIGPEELYQRLSGTESCQLIDVRERAEFAEERLDGSVSLPLSRLHKDWHLIDNERTAYLVCRSGKRAEIAALELRHQGGYDIRVVEGGLDGWLAAGFPLKQLPTSGGERQILLMLSAALVVLLPLLTGGDPFPLAMSALSGAILLWVAFIGRQSRLTTAAVPVPTAPTTRS